MYSPEDIEKLELPPHLWEVTAYGRGDGFHYARRRSDDGVERHPDGKPCACPNAAEYSIAAVSRTIKSPEHYAAAYLAQVSEEDLAEIIRTREVNDDSLISMVYSDYAADPAYTALRHRDGYDPVNDPFSNWSCEHDAEELILAILAKAAKAAGKVIASKVFPVDERFPLA